MNWNKVRIADLLRTNDKAVERAMVALYQRQTTDEQATNTTRHDNQRGFRANHASKGSYYARWVLSGKRLTGHHLTNARNIALHYTQQLADEANVKVTSQPADRPKSRQAEFGFNEREMQRIESEGDRAQTQREEAAKFNARMRMESTHCLRPYNLPCFCVTCEG